MSYILFFQMGYIDRSKFSSKQVKLTPTNTARDSPTQPTKACVSTGLHSLNHQLRLPYRVGDLGVLQQFLVVNLRIIRARNFT